MAHPKTPKALLERITHSEIPSEKVTPHRVGLYVGFCSMQAANPSPEDPLLDTKSN